MCVCVCEANNLVEIGDWILSLTKILIFFKREFIFYRLSNCCYYYQIFSLCRFLLRLLLLFIAKFRNKYLYIIVKKL